MKQNFFDTGILKASVLGLMPKPPASYMVTKAQQEKEMLLLKETIGSGRFFFVINLENFELEHIHGVEQWLGYSEGDFTFKKYMDEVVHPGKKKTMTIVAAQLFKLLCTGKHPLSFMVQRYSSLIALKHSNSKYLLANKISSVFQYDKNNCLIAYLNEFTIINEYAGQPMDPRFFLATGEEEKQGEIILKKTIEEFLKLGVFTERELQIARKLAYEPGIKKNQIADSFQLSIHTVDEYGKRFLSKARKFFQKEFSGVSDAALYLKKEGLL